MFVLRTCGWADVHPVELGGGANVPPVELSDFLDNPVVFDPLLDN